MPIEFRCGECGKLLRAGDATAGNRIKCTSCGTVQQIPAASASAAQPAISVSGEETADPLAAAAAPPLLPLPDEEVNPYQSPLAPTTLDPPLTTPTPTGDFQPTPIEAGEILNRTWEIFLAEIWTCTLAASIVGICELIFSLAINRLALGPLGGRGAQPGNLRTLILQLVVLVPNLLFSTWLDGGLAVYLLKIARGERPSMDHIFAAGRWYFPLLIARALFALMYFAGAICCLVPGIVLALMFSQYFYLIVDRKLTIGNSVVASSQLTSGNKFQLFVLHLAAIGILLFGGAACCVGIFPASGYVQLMWAVTYLVLSGQPTTDQATLQPKSAEQIPRLADQR